MNRIIKIKYKQSEWREKEQNQIVVYRNYYKRVNLEIGGITGWIIEKRQLFILRI